ncbi:MAG: hypothetical protein JSU73_01375 [candidate division WOR-3 bacterium]|nr:MAG: hypothetical protein JSU73_01375 [candidate division WOR-3 bacterium]
MQSDAETADHDKRRRKRSAVVGLFVLLVMAVAVVAVLLYAAAKEDWEPGQEAEYRELGNSISNLEAKCDDFLARHGPLAGTEAELMRTCRWRLSSALTALRGYRASRDTLGRRRVLEQVGNIVGDAAKDYEKLTAGR